jgi:hypothetical protein
MNFNIIKRIIYSYKRRIIEGRGFLLLFSGPKRIITLEVEIIINILLKRIL